MLIAHISDFHVLPAPALCYGFSDTRAALSHAVEALNVLEPRPDLVIGSGDLVDEPSEQAYETLKKILDRLTLPLVLIPGNHDERALLARTYPEQPYSAGPDGLACFVIDFEAFRLVAFDAVVPHREYAQPSVAALAWLQKTLAAAPQRPTLLLMHHPPIRTGITFMDAIQPPNFRALETVLNAHPQVRLILCGHVHRQVEGMLGNVRVSSAGSTAHQFALIIDPEKAPRITSEPAMIRLHQWHQGQVVSYSTPVAREFSTATFSGIDDARWKTIREALRSGTSRGTAPPVEKC